MSKNKIKLSVVSVVLLLSLLVGLTIGGCGAVDTSGRDRAQLTELLQSNAISADETVALALYDNAAVAAGECATPRILDQWFTEQDVNWLKSKYGDALSWYCTPTHAEADFVFRLTELRESCGPAVYIANIRTSNGAPLEGRAVVRYWPGAPALPYYDPPASRYVLNDDSNALGVVGWTSAVGDVGFGVGAGDGYWPDTGSGVSSLYVADYDGPSDRLDNLGWLNGTEHCTIFGTWTRVAVDDIVTPTPTATATATPGPTVTPGPYPTLLPSGLYKIEGLYLQLESVVSPDSSTQTSPLATPAP